jgi:hypothetical protein
MGSLDQVFSSEFQPEPNWCFSLEWLNLGIGSPMHFRTESPTTSGAALKVLLQAAPWLSELNITLSGSVVHDSEVLLQLTTGVS